MSRSDTLQLTLRLIKQINLNNVSRMLAKTTRRRVGDLDTEIYKSFHAFSDGEIAVADRSEPYLGFSFRAALLTPFPLFHVLPFLYPFHFPPCFPSVHMMRVPTIHLPTLM